MRTEAEVQEMVATLRRINDRLWEQQKRSHSVSDNEQVAFNHNGTLLCALDWVLGADTLKVTRKKPKPKGGGG